MTLRIVLATLGIVAGSLTAAEAPSSAEDLMRQVLIGLESRNEEGLRQLLVSREEFKKYIWPTLGGKLSNIRKITAEEYFDTYRKGSDAGLAAQRKTLCGKKWELVKLSFGPERKGKGYRILPRAEGIVRNASVEQKTLPLAGTVLEEGGRYKIASFYVRETTQQ